MKTTRAHVEDDDPFEKFGDELYRKRPNDLRNNSRLIAFCYGMPIRRAARLLIASDWNIATALDTLDEDGS